MLERADANGCTHSTSRSITYCTVVEGETEGVGRRSRSTPSESEKRKVIQKAFPWFVKSKMHSSWMEGSRSEISFCPLVSKSESVTMTLSIASEYVIKSFIDVISAEVVQCALRQLPLASDVRPKATQAGRSRYAINFVATTTVRI